MLRSCFGSMDFDGSSLKLVLGYFLMQVARVLFALSTFLSVVSKGCEKWVAAHSVGNIFDYLAKSETITKSSSVCIRDTTAGQLRTLAHYAILLLLCWILDIMRP